MGNCLGKEHQSPDTIRGSAYGNGSSNRSNADVVRFFLIGTGQVGKSTIIKQLRKLCKTNSRNYQEFDEEWQPQSGSDLADVARWTRVVHHNALLAIATLIEKAKEWGFKYSSKELQDNADQILDHCEDLETMHQRSPRVDSQIAEKMIALLKEDKGALQRTLARRHELILSDSAEYFLNVDKIKEMSQEGYRPDDDDIIRARDPTTGVACYYFQMHNMRIQIQDMGGQPMERARIPYYLTQWLSDVTRGQRSFILYVAAMSDYNIPTPERPDKTLFDESLALLQVLLSHRATEQCRFLFFLNKHDIFMQKATQMNDFTKYFKKFLKPEDRRKYDEGKPLKPAILEQAVAGRLGDAVAQSRPDARCYYRFTTAVDTMIMDSIFGSVRTDIMNNTVEQATWVQFP